MNKISVNDRALSTKPIEMRKVGMIPGTLYGPEIDSTPIQSSAGELNRALAKDGEIYEVKSKHGSVLVKFGEIQTDPVTSELIHFSLVRLPKGVKNEISIPLNFYGDVPGIKQGGVLMTLHDQIKISAKPGLVPPSIDVDVSSLSIGDKLTFGDIQLTKGIDLAEVPDETIIVCQPPKMVEGPSFDEAEKTPDELLEIEEVKKES